MTVAVEVHVSIVGMDMRYGAGVSVLTSHPSCIESLVSPCSPAQ